MHRARPPMAAVMSGGSERAVGSSTSLGAGIRPHRRRPVCVPCGSVRPPELTCVCTILQACVCAHSWFLSVPVEFHLHPWAYSNSPELGHLENCPCEGPFSPYLQRRLPHFLHISFSFAPGHVALLRSLCDALSGLLGVNPIPDIQPEICSGVFHDLSQSNLPTFTNCSHLIQVV